jgi:hypothetical protein
MLVEFLYLTIPLIDAGGGLEGVTGELDSARIVLGAVPYSIVKVQGFFTSGELALITIVP